MRKNDEKYKYTGKEKDITGLYYFGARYYDPVIGRFTTRDPERGNIMNPQSMNPYAYCMNNPMKYIDPNGESPWDHEWLPDGAVAPDEKRLEEYIEEIQSGDHNFDEETVGRIREWSHRSYEERTRFWSKEHDFPIDAFGFEVNLSYILGLGESYTLGLAIGENGIAIYSFVGFSEGADASVFPSIFFSSQSAEEVASSKTFVATGPTLPFISNISGMPGVSLSGPAKESGVYPQNKYPSKLNIGWSWGFTAGAREVLEPLYWKFWKW